MKRSGAQRKTTAGAPLGVARFRHETGIKETDWHGKFWARLGDALREAGFEPNPFCKAYAEDKLIEKFISSCVNWAAFLFAANSS